jgi:hypothetical protein
MHRSPVCEKVEKRGGGGREKSEGGDVGVKLLAQVGRGIRIPRLHFQFFHRTNVIFRIFSPRIYPKVIQGTNEACFRPDSPSAASTTKSGSPIRTGRQRGIFFVLHGCGWRVSQAQKESLPRTAPKQYITLCTHSAPPPLSLTHADVLSL